MEFITPEIKTPDYTIPALRADQVMPYTHIKPIINGAPAHHHDIYLTLRHDFSTNEWEIDISTSSGGFQLSTEDGVAAANATVGALAALINLGADLNNRKPELDAAYKANLKRFAEAK